MKKKSSSKTVGTRKDEFRYHNTVIKTSKTSYKKRHPAYIWQSRGNSYDYYTLTHSNYVPGVKVKKLKVNPDPKDKRDSYISVKSKTDLKSSFGKKQKGWRMNSIDKKELIEKKKKR